MCKIFNATNRFSAEQSIKKAPILEFIFTQCLLNYTMLERYLGQPVNPQGHQTSQWFLTGSSGKYRYTNNVYIYIYIHTALKHVYSYTKAFIFSYANKKKLCAYKLSAAQYIYMRTNLKIKLIPLCK